MTHLEGFIQWRRKWSQPSCASWSCATHGGFAYPLCTCTCDHFLYGQDNLIQY